MSTFEIPELLSQIAVELDDVADLSRLSLCDHFTNEVVAPLFFKNINVASRSLPALSRRFADHPEFARNCRSFVIRGRQLGTDRRIEQPDIIRGFDADTMPSPQLLSQSISLIMREICQNGRLEIFRWSSTTSRQYPEIDHATGVNFIIYPIQAEFWTALSSTGNNLQELCLEICNSDREGFDLLTRNGDFPNLRILRLYLLDDQIPQDFQAFISRLKSLQHLDLWIYAGTRDISLRSITFESTHPLLRSLSLELSPLGLPQDLDFIDRHPTIEVLKLHIMQPFWCSDSSLPNLRALSVEQTTVLGCPAFVSSTAGRKIKHLRLNEMPLFESPMVRDIVLGTATSLTCLEMDFGQIDDFRYWLRDMSALLRLVPNLIEFGMIGRSPTIQPMLPSFGAKDLTDLLGVLDESCHLEAIRFSDAFKSGSVLPESLLQNLGKVPASLRYIKWDVHPDPKIYFLETRNQCTTAIPMTRPPVVKDEVDWTSDSILDHLS
ncbi:hypothetical protein DFH09DRAFT_369435 [Mycena vulgaris]|nr:hypothetical protein DFH09DRAFT_369435 [Mycena vulgaris]